MHSFSQPLLFHALSLSISVCVCVQVDKPCITWHMLIPGDTIQLEYQGVHFSVTAIDANHCPGSIMLLFHSCAAFPGALLHTGDVRFQVRGCTHSCPGAQTAAYRHTATARRSFPHAFFQP